MKYWIRLLGLPAVAAFLVCLPVWAADSDGRTSEILSNQMYCSVGGLLEGNVGLLLGLVLVFMGIWAMVQGAKILAVLPVIIVGSLVTALPSLIESSFGGLGALLEETGISPARGQPSGSSGSGPIFSPPECPAEELSPTPRNTDNDYFGPPMPPVFKNSSGSPDDRN